jgi:predicted amidohydrolase
MTRTGKSLVGFGAYAMFMGAGLLIAPNTMLFLLLTKPTTEHWIRLLGTSAIVLGGYYIVAGRNDLTVMARASLWGHALMIVSFTTLVVLGLAPVLLLGIAGNEAVGLGWTWWALKADAQAAARR